MDVYLYIAIMCDDIPDPIGGQIHFISDDKAPFMSGTTATYSCDDGSTPIGTVNPIVNPRVCMGDGSSNVGQWTGENLVCD